MKRLLMILVIVFCSISYSSAQNYSTGIGFRGGFSNGLTIKHFIGETAAIEGIISSRWRGYSITGLYELHNQAFDVEGLYWYYGAGGHIGVWNGKDTSWGNNDEDYTVIGIDGILGIEYNFNEIPINISLDWKPTMNLIGYSGFWGDGGALSVRYIF